MLMSKVTLHRGERDPAKQFFTKQNHAETTKALQNWHTFACSFSRCQINSQLFCLDLEITEKEDVLLKTKDNSITLAVDKHNIEKGLHI